MSSFRPSTAQIVRKAHPYAFGALAENNGKNKNTNTNKNQDKPKTYTKDELMAMKGKPTTVTDTSLGPSSVQTPTAAPTPSAGGSVGAGGFTASIAPSSSAAAQAAASGFVPTGGSVPGDGSAPAAPQPQGSSYTLPLLVGGALLLGVGGYFYFTKKKQNKVQFTHQ